MVSIIIPTYNEEKALPKTLQVLCSQPGEFETILVDGGSIDRTRAVAERFGFADRIGDGGGLSLFSRWLSHERRFTSSVDRSQGSRLPNEYWGHTGEG